jgi:hypothetical protein
VQAGSRGGIRNHGRVWRRGRREASAEAERGAKTFLCEALLEREGWIKGGRSSVAGVVKEIQQLRKDVFPELEESLLLKADVALGEEGSLLRKRGVARWEKGLPEGNAGVVAVSRLSHSSNTDDRFGLPAAVFFCPRPAF